jgi:penicillin-binding protein 1A
VTGAWVGFNDPRVMLRSNHWGQGANNALHVVGDFTRQALGERVLNANAEFPTRGTFAVAVRRFGERLRRWLGIEAPQ